MQYKILSPVRDGIREFGVGEIVDFFGDHAEALLKAKAIEPFHLPFAKETASGMALDLQAIQKEMGE